MEKYNNNYLFYTDFIFAKFENKTDKYNKNKRSVKQILKLHKYVMDQSRLCVRFILRRKIASQLRRSSSEAESWKTRIEDLPLNFLLHLNKMSIS